MRRNQPVWIRLFGGLVVLALLLLPLQSAGAAGTIRYVKPGGLNKGTCLSWATACNLQWALSMKALPGNKIWVAKGIYKPDTLSPKSRTATFALKNNVAILGGFVVGGTLATRNPKINITILSGNIGSAAIADNSYHVVTANGVNSSAILDGFTVQSGYAVNGVLTDQSSGAGMYIANGSPTLRNLIFQMNTAFNQGGGMYNLNSSPTLTNVIFKQNSGGTIGGGGMYNDNSSPRLNNVRFNGNTAGTDGGGMYNNNFTGPSNPILNNVTFIGNRASNGGGLDNRGSSPALANVTFSGNVATNNGGGMYNNQASSPTLNGVTFSANSAVNGGGMYNNTGSGPLLSNVTFSGNTASTVGGGVANQSSNPVLNNITFSGNSTAVVGNGGGMYNADSTLQIYNTILWADGTATAEVVNSASVVTIMDSVVMGSLAASDCLGDGQSTCARVFQGNPVLGPLQNNGGLTLTRAIGAGSSALNKGGVSWPCAPRDQRGVIRPQGPACDIGAFEKK